MEIKYSPNVIGCRVGDEIFLNPALKSGSKLHTAILTHEKKHSNRFTMDDLKIDLAGENLNDVRSEYWKFIFKHPRTMLSFLPITKIGRYWGFDVTMLVMWLLLLIIFGVIILI